MPRWATQEDYKKKLAKLKEDRAKDRLREVKAQRMLEDKARKLLGKLLMEEGSESVRTLIDGWESKFKKTNRDAWEYVVKILAQPKPAETDISPIESVSTEGFHPESSAVTGTPIDGSAGLHAGR